MLSITNGGIREIAMWRTFSVVCGGVVLLFIASLARANVIYDVVVTYQGGLALTFAMEFATDGGVKGAADLLPSGDFLNERVNGGGPFDDREIHLSIFDFDTDDLFNAQLGKKFHFDSRDSYVGVPECGTSRQQTQSEFECTFDGRIIDNRPRLSIEIVKRADTPVPVPATLALVLVGLPGLWLRRPIRGRRAARSVPAIA